MKKKIIGIPGWKIGENSYGVTSTYLEFMSKIGVPRIIMPWEDLVKVDLLILPGGLDINPASYGELPGFTTSHSDVFKQYFYDQKLKNYIGNIPIFGICLGFQQLAVYFGSKLTQNLKFHTQSDDRWKAAHPVYNNANKITMKIKEGEVNSHHHQGVLESQLSLDLKALLFAENEENVIDPIVEAFCHTELPIAAVQWHPEELYDNITFELIDHLI